MTLVKRNGLGRPLSHGEVDGNFEHILDLTKDTIIDVVRDFGAVGDGETDDADSIQAAFDSLLDAGGGHLIFPPRDFLVGRTVNLPVTRNGAGTFRVLGHGALVKTTEAISAFSRTVESNTAALASIGDRFVFDGLGFVGNQTSGQTGIKFGASYSSVFRNMHFENLGTGLDILFGLNTLVDGCMATNNITDAFVARNGDWTGAGITNSQSNNTTFRNCRVFAKSGAFSSYKILGASGVTLSNCISEGANSQYGVYFDWLTSSVVKSFFLSNFHSENEPTASAIYIKTPGVVEISGLFHQMGGVIIHSDYTSCSLIVRNMPYRQSAARFKGLGSPNNQAWVFDNCYVGDLFDSEIWDGGNVPTRLTVSGVGQTAIAATLDSRGPVEVKSRTNSVILNGSNGIQLYTDAPGRLRTNMHTAASAAQLGEVINKIEVRDASGAFIGHLPLYDTP